MQGALAHRLQHRTACKIQNGHQGAAKWPTGSGKGSNPREKSVENIGPLTSLLVGRLNSDRLQRQRSGQFGKRKICKNNRENKKMENSIMADKVKYWEAGETGILVQWILGEKSILKKTHIWTNKKRDRRNKENKK